MKTFAEDPSKGRTSHIAYLLKCVFTIILSVGSLILSLDALASGSDFDFKFTCELTDDDMANSFQHTSFCISKAVGFSLIVQYAFVCIVVVIILSNLWGLLEWLGLFHQKDLVSRLRRNLRYNKITRKNEVAYEGMSGNPLLRRLSTARTSLQRRGRGPPTGRGGGGEGGEDDPTLNDHFLFSLLKEAERPTAVIFAVYSLPEFHDELEKLVANLSFPENKLIRDHVVETVDDDNEEKMLILMKEDFEFLPVGIKSLPLKGHIIDEANFSYCFELKHLRHVEHLVNLRSLKCRGCQLDAAGVEPVASLTLLQFLDLTDNQIGELPKGFRQLSLLKWLWVEENPLEGFNRSMIRDDLQSLVEIRVEAEKAEGLRPSFAEIDTNQFTRVTLTSVVVQKRGSDNRRNIVSLPF